MGIEQWLTPCIIKIEPPGKDGNSEIKFSKPNDDNVIHALYSILAQTQVQDNYEGCEVVKVEVANDEGIDIVMPIEDFK